MKTWLLEFMETLRIIPWVSVFMLVTFAFLVTLMIRWHLMPTSKQRYDFSDLFKDEITRRASLGNLIIIFFAVLSGWVVVQLVQRDKPVETLLLGVLAVFVANGLVKRGINAYTAVSEGPKPATGAATEESATTK